MFWFLVFILLGAIALMQPFSHTSTSFELSFLDSFFTATSAFTVTGLIVVPTGTFFNNTGMLIILFLIQIGGFGIVTVASFIELKVLGRDHNIKDINKPGEIASNWHRIPELIRFIFIFVLITQFIGAIALWQYTEFSAFESIFHSISAFNNAGFSTFENSLVNYQSDIVVNGILITLVFLGSIGFVVVFDTIKYILRDNNHIPLHSKLPIELAIILFLIGFFATFIDLNMSIPEMDSLNQILVSAFQSTIYRTAGFNSIDLTEIGKFGNLIGLLLMIIGGGTVSMAGGLTPTNVYLFLKDFYYFIVDKGEIRVRKNFVPMVQVRTARFIVITYLLVFLGSIIGLTFTEQHNNEFGIFQYSYEVISSLSTVGTSLGVTSSLTNAGKIIIIFDMIIGRYGVYYIIKEILYYIHVIRTLPKSSINKTENIELIIG